jgi:hypothetical protein
MMSGISFEKLSIIKFDRLNNLRLWLRSVKDLLVEQDMVKTLYRKQPEGMTNKDWQEFEARVVETIMLFLDDDVMYHVMDE